MAYFDPILQVFGDDPEALKEFERIKALRGEVDTAKRLQRLGAVGALATDEGLRGFGDNLYRTGVGQEASRMQAMQEGYEGLKQTRTRAKERAGEQAWREQQHADEQAYRQQQIALQRAQEARMAEQAARAAEAEKFARETRDLAAAAKMREERKGVSRAVSSAEENMRTINQALQHPGRGAATGLSGEIARRLPYTDARGYQSVEKKILGGAFLQAFDTLKGGGQITEVEGKKATEAITRLGEPGLPEHEYEAALNELRNVVQTGLDRAKAEGYEIGMYRDLPGLPSGNPAVQQPNAFGLQPNAFGMPAAGMDVSKYFD